MYISEKAIVEFHNESVARIMAGDVDAVLGLMHFPLPVFRPDGFRIHVSAADIGNEISEITKNLLLADVASAEAEFSEFIIRERTGEALYRAKQTFSDNEGCVLNTNECRKVVENVAGQLKVTMIEFLQPGLSKTFERCDNASQLYANRRIM